MGRFNSEEAEKLAAELPYKYIEVSVAIDWYTPNLDAAYMIDRPLHLFS